MPLIPTRPPIDPPSGPTTVPADGGRLDAGWAWITAHQGSITYGVATVLAVLLVISIRSRRKRGQVAGDKAAITGVDRAITRVTGLVATGVLAVGMWGFFTDVLHLNPIFRVILFAFVEGAIVAAFRRGRRTLHRHGHLGTATRTIYGLAFGSAIVAASHASEFQEAIFRLFVATVAAYMLAEELAEERDIFLKANPNMVGEARRTNRRINWSLTPERVLVWLRLAEPSQRDVEDIERQRRIARFARTAYRLDTLKTDSAAKWRIRRARRTLRRQAEAANEHLSVATDLAAMTEIRSQLAFLYQVEDGTTRRAVADLSPFRPAPKLAIAATPFVTGQHPTVDADMPASMSGDMAGDTAAVLTPDSRPDVAPPSVRVSGTDNTPAVSPDAATGHGEAPASDSMVARTRTSARTSRRTVSAPRTSNDQLRAYRLKDKDPDITFVEIARKLGVADKTVSRWFKARDASDDPEEQASGPDIPAPFASAVPRVLAGVNGYHPTPAEEN